ncbi:MAG: hypothetical protein M1480_13105 [Bacteroidetes bacterium]|nr:hypothetical protein [Bacteroidota bacterium]
MKLQIALFILLIFKINSYCQTANFNFDQYNIKIENSKLNVTSKSGKLFLEKNFNNPHELSIDLDSDGINEYLIIDEKKDSSRILYTLYIFNTVDSFYVADSIPSGCLEPYIYFSKETNKNIIVTGNSKFDSFNKDSEDTFIPINCWIYDNAEIFSVNDEVYNIFISENEKLIDIIDAHFSMNSEDCKSTETIKAAIAAVYANYISAGEKILANQFLKKYYHCNDLEKFKQTLNELL